MTIPLVPPVSVTTAKTRCVPTFHAHQRQDRRPPVVVEADFHEQDIRGYHHGVHRNEQVAHVQAEQGLAETELEAGYEVAVDE